MSALVVAQGTQEVHPSEVRPERIAEVVLGVSRLPQQEPREAYLAGRADDQVGVRHPGRVQMSSDVLIGQFTRNLAEGAPRGSLLEQQCLDGIDDFPAPAVPDGNLHEQPVVVGRGFGRLGHRSAHRLRKQIKGTDRLHTDVAISLVVGRRHANDGVLDDLEQGGELALLAIEVVGREQPERDVRDRQFGAPAQELVDLGRAREMTVGGLLAPNLREPAIAVENHGDVCRERVEVERGQKLALVGGIEQSLKVHLREASDLRAIGSLAANYSPLALHLKPENPMADNWLSQEAHDRLKAELDDLKGVGRKEVSAEIEVAREHGDLKENAEYHAAKDKQGHMEARIRQLEELLRNAKIGQAPAGGDTVVPGLVVTLDIDGDDETYLVGSREDAHPDHDILSADSPIGKAVIGVKVGSTVSADTPGGTIKITVVKIASL
jgi:transcription elongation factor GreA